MNSPQRRALEEMAKADRPMTLAQLFPSKNWMGSLIQAGWAVSTGPLGGGRQYGFIITQAGRDALAQQ